MDSHDARGGASPPPSPPGRAPAVNRFVILIAVLLTVFALKIGRPVVLPVVTALFVLVLAWPLLARLERSMPRWLAFACTVLALLAAIALFGAALGWSAQSVAERLPEYKPRLEQLRSQAEAWARGHGIPVPSGRANDERVLEQGLSLAKRVATAVQTALGLLVLVLAFALLGLLEVRDFGTKVRRRFDGRRAAELIQVAGQISRAFRRYFVIKTLTSAITGTATGLLALAFGLDFAFVWGLAAFLLEYVPTLGSIAAVIPPSAFAFLQFDGIGKPLAALAAFSVLQITLGNIVDPRLEGRFMSLSPVVVLVSIVFWAWVWGPLGALLGVPMTVAVVVTCEHFASTRWISALLTDVREDAADDASGGRAPPAGGEGGA